MKLLLRLYPRAWQRRYRCEMEALLAETSLSPRDGWDLLRGAVDARVNPQNRLTWWSSRWARDWVRALILGILAVIAGLVSGNLYLRLYSWTWEVGSVHSWSFNEQARLAHLDLSYLELAAAWVGIALLLTPWQRLRPLALLAGLLGLRYAVDLVAVGLALPVLPTPPLPTLAELYSVPYDPLPALAVTLFWTVLTAPLLRLRMSPRRAVLLALALELVLGRPDVAVALAYAHIFSLVPHGILGPSPIPSTAYLIQAALWAAAVTWIITRAGRRPGWDPGPGLWPAGVAVRPQGSPGFLVAERLLSRWRARRQRPAAGRDDALAEYQETMRPGLTSSQ